MISEGASQPDQLHGYPAGEQLIGTAGLRAFHLINNGGLAETSYFNVDDQPFSEAIRANIQYNTGHRWDIQLQAPTVGPIEKDDVLYATLYFRTEHSHNQDGEGQAELVFELASSPWTKSVNYPVRANHHWRKISIPFVVAHNYAGGEAQICLRLGFAPQIVEIGGLSVQNFRRGVTLADLPKTRLIYPGMEEDAPWRKAAAERINTIRKGALVVMVKDRAGNPVPGATVSAKLVKHAFPFGTCAPAAILVSSDHQEFKRILSETFNIVTLENDLKWVALSGDWGPDYTLERAKQGTEWLRERGFKVRGHHLVCPGWEHLPKSLRPYEKNPTQLRYELQQHIRERVTAMNGSLVHWDVVNNPFDNRDLEDVLGPEVIVDWFKEAHSADPDAKLFISDYGILSGDTSQGKYYERTIKMVLDKGAPLDGIGMHGYFEGTLPSPEDMLAILDRFAKFEKPIWITEFDLSIHDETLGSRFVRDFYTAMFSHPSVEGIMMWGFWDGAHWRNDAPMYRHDWTLKPSGEAIRDLLFNVWSTNSNGTTDNQGIFGTLGFFGEYEVLVSAAGKTKIVNTVLEAGGTNVTVVLG